MSKTYLIWWHSQFIDEINRDSLSIEDIIDKTNKSIKNLEKFKVFEKEGKLKVKQTGTINPIYIEILDKSIEEEVVNNPAVEVIDKK